MNDSLPTDLLPVIGNRYWVRCENSWCMAVVDEHGNWKSFSNGKELRDVINFFPI